jgi:hypothetical protein
VDEGEKTARKEGFIYSEARRTVHLIDVYDLDGPDHGLEERRFVVQKTCQNLKFRRSMRWD